MTLIESKYFEFYQLFPSINEVIELLERAPIIPDFNKTKDVHFLKKIDEQLNNRGVILSSHRLVWVAKK